MWLCVCPKWCMWSLVPTSISMSQRGSSTQRQCLPPVDVNSYTFQRHDYLTTKSCMCVWESDLLALSHAFSYPAFVSPAPVQRSSASLASYNGAGIVGKCARVLSSNSPSHLPTTFLNSVHLPLTSHLLLPTLVMQVNEDPKATWRKQSL
jgi:hypothetical protein